MEKVKNKTLDIFLVVLFISAFQAPAICLADFTGTRPEAPVDTEDTSEEDSEQGETAE